MSRARVRLGQFGEEKAARALSQQGYEVIDRNWRCREGEVDIVARKSGVWTFFEVRTQRGRGFGAPEESVSPAKEQRMYDVAQAYLMEHADAEPAWRVGFVAIEVDAAGKLLRVTVYDPFV